jgi:ribosome maturation factor RimP
MKEGTLSPFLLFMTSENNIKELVSQWITDSDKFLVEVITTSGKISVYIDKPDGITIKECSELARYLINELDEEVLEKCKLEVSSPGIDQPFKVFGQYLRNVGRELSVTVKGGEIYTGILKTVDKNKIELIEQKKIKKNKKKIILEESNIISLNDIDESKLVMNFKFK